MTIRTSQIIEPNLEKFLPQPSHKVFATTINMEIYLGKRGKHKALLKPEQRNKSFTQSAEEANPDQQMRRKRAQNP